METTVNIIHTLGNHKFAVSGLNSCLLSFPAIADHFNGIKFQS